MTCFNGAAVKRFSNTGTGRSSLLIGEKELLQALQSPELLANLLKRSGTSLSPMDVCTSVRTPRERLDGVRPTTFRSRASACSAETRHHCRTSRPRMASPEALQMRLDAPTLCGAAQQCCKAGGRANESESVSEASLILGCFIRGERDSV